MTGWRWLIVWWFLITSPLFALTSRVVIVDGGSEALRDSIEMRLTAIVNILQPKEFNGIKDYFTPDAYDVFVDLVNKTSCRNVNPLYEAELLALPGGGWEIRDIKVLIDMGATRGNPYHYLVFAFDDQGVITDVRFALEQHQYQSIVQEGEKLQDFLYRQYILQFLEIFRTAYNRKDIDYLRQIYSDDALIIVGRILKTKPDVPDYYERSTLTREKIQLIKLSKQQYIASLEKVFAQNEFIKVNFNEIELRQHPEMNKIYGVTLKQDWHSSSYSDEGYLFLMIDFRDEANPTIHVRSWQPQAFSDGSVVSIGDFELIE
jgi:hypothetical protein